MAATFGSNDPNCLQGLGRTNQTAYKVWVERPKLPTRFGSNDPNCLPRLGRSTQTAYKVWVKRPKLFVVCCVQSLQGCMLAFPHALLLSYPINNTERQR